MKELHENIQFGVLPLNDLAIKYEKDYYGAEENWFERDIKPLFFQHLSALINRGHLIIIQVNGKVSSGKSTIGIYLMNWINNELKKRKLLNPKYINKNNLLIFSDHTEFWKKADKLSYQDPITKKWLGVCAEIDEENTMIKTGANSTVEQHSYEYKSDVFAQKNIHRIYCSPTNLTDQNVDIILWCEPAQKEYGFTDVKVKYRNLENNRITTLGRLRIHVKDLIKSETYMKYLEKKFLRMTMFENHGIKDYRDFTDAGIILETFKKLELKSKIERIPETKVKSMLSITLAKNSIMYSFLGSDEVIVKVKTMLDLNNDIIKTNKKINNLKRNINDDNMDYVPILKESLKQDEMDLNEMIKFYEHRLKLKEKYDTLMEKFEK